jgi:hypothetical protein
MALCLRGKTPCSICGVVLQEGDDVVLHPHVLPSDHPLWRFSDSSMHRVCYQQWECHEYFETILRKYRDLWNARPAALRLTRQQIDALTREGRARFFAELEQWSRTNFQEVKRFLSGLGSPPTIDTA